MLFNRRARVQSPDLNERASVYVWRKRRESVCVCVCVCALMCALSKYLGGFSCQGENEYWNDYQLINDPV